MWLTFGISPLCANGLLAVGCLFSKRISGLFWLQSKKEIESEMLCVIFEAAGLFTMSLWKPFPPLFCSSLMKPYSGIFQIRVGLHLKVILAEGGLCPAY